MNFIEKYIDRFIYPEDKMSPDNLRKGRFFILSAFLILFLMVVTAPLLVLLVPDEAVFTLVFNGFVVVLLTAMIFAFRKFGKRILFANILAIMLLSPFVQTYQKTGGIYSSDSFIILIIASWIFLVADKKSGIVWFGVCFIWWLSLSYFAQINTRDFLSDFNKMSANYHLFNYVTAGFFMMLIIYLYEQGKDKYLKEVMKSKSEIEEKNKELEIKNQEVMSSINYAKRIQYAVLPHEETIYRSIPLSFILYKPRDIVSGDFFWFNEIDEKNFILVCADCTGHGVPGAFMTVIGSSSLNQIVTENKIIKPSEILFELDKKIMATLKQEKQRIGYVPDGMDLSLLKVNKEKKQFTFTSAKRTAILIRNKQIEELKGNKNSLGGLRGNEKIFEETIISYNEDDIIYLFTDGYIDQFGGEKNKKFMIKQFREVLLNIHPLPMSEQKQKLDSAITTWIGKNEQTDDITVMGIRF